MSNKFKILVVEDNDFVRMQICSFINDAGHDTVEATDGEQALDAINGDIALAVVDVRMEPMGGFEFITAIRADNIKTPVMLVTGDDDPYLLSEASKHGVVAILKKPVQKDRLIKMISRVLGVDNG